MTPTRTDSTSAKRAADKLARDQDFARIAAAVAAAANPANAVATTPPVPAGNTAAALIALERGGV